MGQSSVFPTGTIKYDPQKAYNGYTLVPTINDGILLFDMNGNEVRRWDFRGFPPKMLPGGHIIGNSGNRHPRYGMQDGVNLMQISYDGEKEWEFDHFDKIADPGADHHWMSRQHHDFQREGQAVYYVPGEEPKIDGGKTLILGHRTIHNPAISDKKLLDDVVYEVDWEGNVLWEWSVADHFADFNFGEAAKNVLARDPNLRQADGGIGDFMHTNCASYLGPNHWYDEGDERFKPNNIIMDGRETNILFVVDHDTGEIVWQIGPDYQHDPRLKKLGQVIGQHALHMIPQGLPGAGNLLFFDNGGWAGYGDPNPGSFTGIKNARRDYSRVVELNPVTLEVVWELTPEKLGYQMPTDASKFYSPYVSNAQRLPNGNTLVDEGSDGRLIEVTPDFEIVWEWVSPYFNHTDDGGQGTTNMIYRAYRYPYDYVPQEPRPTELPVGPVDNSTFRLPNAGKKGAKTVVKVAGTLPYYKEVALCVATKDEEEQLTAKPKLFHVDRTALPELDAASFKQQVLGGGAAPQVVMFGAERCRYCKQVYPVLKNLLEGELKGKLTGAYVDVDAQGELVEMMQLLGLPVLVVFKNGQEVARLRGAVPEGELKAFLQQAIGA